MYTYKLTDIRVVDGDTIEATIDLGFRNRIHKQPIRLLGVDAPEAKSKDPEERAQAKQCTERVKELIVGASTVILVSKKLDKYGRVLGHILLNGNEDLAMILLAEGLVVPA